MIPGADKDNTAQSSHLQQQLLVYGGFSGEAVEGSLWALQQQQQATDTQGTCSWSAQQLHAGITVQSSNPAQQQDSSGSGAGSSSAECCPAPRFAHAATCLPDPDDHLHKVCTDVEQTDQVCDSVVSCWLNVKVFVHVLC